MICTFCKQDKELSEFTGRTERAKGVMSRCRDCGNKNSRDYRRKLKLEFLAAYGGRCTCCGESHQAFLTLEHTNGGGHKERIEAGGNFNLLRRLRQQGWPTEGYTLECYNCNLGKRSNSGICPHRG